ncbi:tRNA pseudouridine synthase [Ceraceosorus guamensis]|uniref:tRNA pseudouridine synthase n=1 Tax=Ceraceosorus guamensis TaxID=1522189 RepID=A0A316W747_9BASI|nr:tRNA pseudouridine synthase [Ceraceosorus guamensis]PWN45669.1 tRNA pseudouridine synthase [Ceraceosorus guamensis]
MAGAASSGAKYEDWSADDLRRRVLELEAKLGNVASASAPLADGPSAPAEAGPSRLPAQPEQEPALSRRAYRRAIRLGHRIQRQGPVSQARGQAVVDDAKARGVVKSFNFDLYPQRKIAIRFAYDGTEYAGLAAQSNAITVESVLWDALVKGRLVDGEKGMQGAGWTRCGRTDRGVSAAGQVVSLWIRSKRVDERQQRTMHEARLAKKMAAYLEAADGPRKAPSIESPAAEPVTPDLRHEKGSSLEDLSLSDRMKAAPPAGESLATSTPDVPSSAQNGATSVKLDGSSPELPYLSVLNGLLPNSIRVLAWSPVAADFSARFSCRYRHYKYFFTAGSPLLPTTAGPSPRLNIDAMREGASRLLGDHDFRNLCKVEGVKQITNFRRRIDGVSIDQVPATWTSKETDSASDEPMYVLNLRGTAFLYHQVRNIMSVLFLIGAGLEKPSLVDELLNIKPGMTAEDARWAAIHGVSLRKDRTVLPGSTATERDGVVQLDSETGLPVMVQTATPMEHDTSWTEQQQQDEEERLESLRVYANKPEYEMASDTSLVLWDCGFRPSDVAWRAGTYDGPLPAPQEADVDSAAAPTAALLHGEWTRRSISAEIWRHFLFSSPVAPVGTQEAGVTFEQARRPTLPAASNQDGTRHKSLGPTAVLVPLGGGYVRLHTSWRGFAKLKREEAPEVKNQRWLEGKGKQRAEALGITPQQLSRGYRPPQ